MLIRLTEVRDLTRRLVDDEQSASTPVGFCEAKYFNFGANRQLVASLVSRPFHVFCAPR